MSHELTLQAGALVPGAEYMQAQRLRAEICRETAGVLEPVDVLATPTACLPALALPCGFSSAGLPLSLQLAGRPFDAALVLRVGDAYEQATEWHARRPPV